MLKRFVVALSLLVGSTGLASEFPEKSMDTNAATASCQSGVPVGKVLIQCSTISYVRLRESPSSAAATVKTGVVVYPGAYYYTNVTGNFLTLCATAAVDAGACSVWSVR